LQNQDPTANLVGVELKKYSPEELFDIVVDTIARNLSHRHYKHVVEHARFCYRIMTGDNQDEYLLRFKLKETGEQKQQRINITNSRTQYASGKICSVFEEVVRSDNTAEHVRYASDNDANKVKIQEIEDRLARFHGETHALTYVYESMKRLNFYDPNAFLIVNFTPFDAAIQKTEFVYPIEVSSEQAIRYEYSNGNLLYLLFYQEVEVMDVDEHGKEKKQVLRNYFLFAADFSYEFLAVPEKGNAEILPDRTVIEIPVMTTAQPNMPTPMPVNAKQILKFQWKRYDTKSQRIPVVQAGYIRDARTQNETFVSPLQAAEKLLLDLIWTKSEYDLAKALHWFYQKFIYAPACEWEDPNTGDRCENGTLSLSGGKCKSCDGTGMMVHTTVQDVIMLRLPQTAAEVVPLENMVHYENIDISIGQHLQEDYKAIEADVFKAVFNSQAFDRSEVAVTATEKTLDLRAVKNALIAFANKCSEVYKFVIKMTAIYTDNAEDIVIQHNHSSDFKLETLEDLVNKRKSLMDAGAPYMMIQAVDMEILAMQNQDSPGVLEIVRAREIFRPYREKSESEKMFILGQAKAEDYHLVLWKFFEDIMSEISFEDKERGDRPWHKLPYPEQKKIVDQKVKKIQDEVKADKEQAMQSLPFARLPRIPEEEQEEIPEQTQENQIDQIAAQ